MRTEGGARGMGYRVATISRLLGIIGLFCRISSLLQGPFAKETYNYKEPTNGSHPILELREYNMCLLRKQHVSVAVCCSVLQCVAVWNSILQCVAVCCSVLQCVAACCSVSQCVGSVLQCVAVCCSVLQCVAVCCSVLQCVP